MEAIEAETEGTAKTSQPEAPAGEISQITAKVREGIKVPDNLRDAYRRLVTAAVNIMYQKKTHKMMVDAIKMPGDLGKNAGESAAGLVLLLFKQSKGDPAQRREQLMIPLGIEIVCQAFEYIEKTNIVPYTKENLGVAIKVMTETVVKNTGGNVNELKKAMGEAPAQPAPPAAPAGAPPAGGPTVAPAGLIGGTQPMTSGGM